MTWLGEAMVIGCQINYDNLGNPRIVLFGNNNVTEYIYAADGTKLRTIHRPAGLSTLTDSIDYIGNLILKNGQPSMYLFDGGYATFNANGAVNGWHYYIQDYMGNNRMVVNKNGTKEQVTHYYPYGGVIGDISTNESLQKYKLFHYIPREQARSEDKELDRIFGLDNYDIHARQYFAMAPMWDKIDPLAEKSPGISPYAYCGGDPVNKVDMDGNVPTVVIGAVIGGVWKGAEAAYNGKNWEQVASAALGGADQIRKFRDKAKDMTGSNNPKVINNKGKRLRESEAKNDFKKANEQYQRDTDEKDLINIIPQSYIGITLDLFYESLFEDN